MMSRRGGSLGSALLVQRQCCQSVVWLKEEGWFKVMRMAMRGAGCVADDITGARQGSDRAGSDGV